MSTTPVFYWYPVSGGTLEKTDFGEALADVQETPNGRGVDAYTGALVGYRSFMGATKRVRIVLERFGSPGTAALEQKFQTLESHLQKGGLVSFSRNDSKTWASKASGTPVRGDTILYCAAGNYFTAFSAAGNLAQYDEAVLESAHPESQREVFPVGVGGGTPRTQVSTPGVVYTYTGYPIVRWRDFYPYCWLPADQLGRSFLTHDHRRNFTLDITLEYSPGMALANWPADPG